MATYNQQRFREIRDSLQHDDKRLDELTPYALRRAGRLLAELAEDLEQELANRPSFDIGDLVRHRGVYAVMDNPDYGEEDVMVAYPTPSVTAYLVWPIDEVTLVMKTDDLPNDEGDTE